jgi:hypothetical protein
MTNNDFNDITEEPSVGPILLKRALIACVGGLVLLFIAGMIAGYTSVVIEHGGPDLVDVGMLSTMLGTGLLIGYAMWRLWPRGLDEPVPPRVRSARMLLIASIAVALPIGIILGITDDGNAALLSNAPVSPGLALLVIGLWCVTMPILSWLWWQRIDEHEADAYRDGAMLSAHVYMIVTPAWWMASRAGWLAPLDPMLMLLAVSVVWGLVWFIRRYF